ncbi:MAG: hypothetical protein KBG40_04435 [Bacteroidales bacterium]|nr:hypothetical protein [Bacteroidales bacterium]
MKIAIHSSKGSFSDRWIAFCESAGINYKIVDCYRNSIIEDIADCNALLWHVSQNNPKATLFAKQLLYSVEKSGKKVFPDFNTVWHFDDKIGQKYLLESIGAPMPDTWIFYDRETALQWAEETEYPKVFKLRSGAGSQNVWLARSRSHAIKIINKAFGRGFFLYNAWGSLNERWRKYRLGKTNFKDVIKGIVRLASPPPYAKVKGKERGYVYFQEFIPGNDYDIRVVIIGDKAFAIKRIVRKNDFRASGSGNILYEKELFDEDNIKLSFILAEKLKTQCIAFDFVYKNKKPFITEISYGFSPEGYDLCPGYWDKELNWYEGHFNPYGWMVENLLNEIKKEKL